MPNLFKYYSNAVNMKHEEKRVINSNNAMQNILKDYAAANPDAVVFDEGNDGPREFVAGLNAEQVDMSMYSEGPGVVFEDEEYETAGEAEQLYADTSAQTDDITQTQQAQQFQLEEMLAEAREEAAAIIAEARTEAENIKAAASQEGYEAGFNHGMSQSEEEVNSLRTEVENEKVRLGEEFKEKEQQMETELVSVVSDIFSKVFSIQFEGKREILLNLVRNAVNQIENSKEFLIKVPKENLQFIMEHKDELQEQVGQYVTIEIISDSDLTDNQCVIHTDSGVFDCSLDIQLDNLVRDLKSLSLH